MSGPDQRDPYAAPGPLGSPDDLDLATLRVATYLDDGISPPDDDIAAVDTAGCGGRRDRRGGPARTPRMRGTDDGLAVAIGVLGGDRGQGFEADLAEIGVSDPSRNWRSSCVRPALSTSP